MNITIDNTSKSGWLKLALNDYYDGSDGDSEHWTCIATGIGGVCAGKINGIDYVELYMSHEEESFLLTWQTTDSEYIRTVATINGVAPTSITDLKTKLLALL